MSRSDTDRVARIMADHESGALTDVAVYAILVSVASEAVIGERQREVLRLEYLAREALRRGETLAANALADAADRHAWRSPTPGDLADA